MMACFIIGCEPSIKVTLAEGNVNPPDWIHGTWDIYNAQNEKSDGYFIFTESEITRHDTSGTSYFSKKRTAKDDANDTSYSVTTFVSTYKFEQDTTNINTIKYTHETTNGLVLETATLKKK